MTTTGPSGTAGGASTGGSSVAGRLLALIRLGRPRFLVGGVVLHAVGAALAWHEGAAVDLAALAWGQLAITAGQLLTHYSNDYFDVAADRLHAHRPRYSGGSRVLAAGELAPRWALAAALVALVVALGATAVLALVVRPGWVTAALFGLAIALAWGYSGPPLRLHGTGAGELAGAVLLAGITPLAGYHLQGGRDLVGAAALLAPLVALQLAMLIVVSLPDAPSDGAAGKRTLAVRAGTRRAAGAAAAAYAAAYVGVAVLWVAGASLALIGAYAVGAPVAAWQAARLLDGAGTDPARWDRAAFWAIGLVVGSAVALAVALGWPALANQSAAPAVPRDPADSVSDPSRSLVVMMDEDRPRGRDMGEPSMTIKSDVMARLGDLISGKHMPPNVGGGERLVSLAIGAPLMAMALRNKSPLRLMVGAMGAEMVYRGVTGRCPVYRAVGVDTNGLGLAHSALQSVPYGKGIRVEESIAVDRPRSEVFAAWRNLENLPRFMQHLRSVSEIDGERSRWVARAPAGTNVAWDAEIIDEEADMRIAWRSLPDADVANAGSVRFSDTADGRGTVVNVALAYRPPAGPLGAAVATLFGQEPSQQVRGDLKRFKAVMETGELSSGVTA